MNPRLLSILLLLSVSPCVAAVKINTTTIPNGRVRSAYSAVIQAYDGCLPYKWTVASAALPPGVKATASSNTAALDLSGTPTTAASDAFPVKVTGCSGGVAQASYRVVIQGGANDI